MEQRYASVSDLCKELGIERVTLYRYVVPKGDGCQGTAKSLYFIEAQQIRHPGDQPDVQQCDVDCIGRD
jgi:hypothetical protein